MYKKLKLKLSDIVSSKLPSLGIYKRWFDAFYNNLISKKRYSQHGEDVIIFDLLKDKDLTKGVYIDVGANHPTSISNTYLFYKKGLSGITIEPNPELAQLHRKFRKRDINLALGISNSAALANFSITKAPVLSSFTTIDPSNYWKTLYVPILTLDNVIQGLKTDWIYFLSIDVEGLNFNVLQGATETLKKTTLLCIEIDNDEDKKVITDFLIHHNFLFIQEIGCNLIFKNSYMN